MPSIWSRGRAAEGLTNWHNASMFVVSDSGINSGSDSKKACGVLTRDHSVLDAAGKNVDSGCISQVAGVER